MISNVFSLVLKYFPKVSAILVLLGLLAGLGYCGKWSFDRLMVAQQVYIYLTTPVHPGGLARAQLIDKLDTLPSSVPPVSASPVPAPEKKK